MMCARNTRRRARVAYTMRTDDLDFHLPPELIAQAPAAERAASRLLHYQRTDQSIAHRRFAELPDLLRAGDLLVFNDARVVRMPLPPYIKRKKDRDERDDADRDRYQTVYARAEGSVAAPTAGLHFTPELLSALAARGVERANVTLNVGLGTFKPITAARVEDHAMHVESYEISRDAANALNRAKRDGRR